jgi:hypothetical protein
MKRTITLSIALIGVLFFTSCKREESMHVDQNRIYTSYSHIYDAQKNQSEMTATFRLDHESGKRLQLTYPSRVDFNGETMAYRSVAGFYQTKITGTSHGGTFNFHDVESKTYSNQVVSASSVELPFGLTSINKNGNFFLPWQGQALQSGETIRVTIKGSEQSTKRTFTVTQPGANHIILDQHQLSGLAAGNAEIQIEREVSNFLTNSTLAGGRITSKYISRKAYITITD